MTRAIGSVLSVLCIVGCGDSGTSNDAGPTSRGDMISAAGDMTPGSVGEPAGLAGITAAHNLARQNAMPAPSPAMAPLTWSSAIAQTAQAHANKCMAVHSGTAGLGENIYAAAGMTPTGASVTESWVSESANYNYAANSCAGTCGHYTQVVWRDSTQLGCAIQACSQNSPFDKFPNWTFVVCNYAPAGNDGGRPY